MKEKEWGKENEVMKQDKEKPMDHPDKKLP